MERRGSSDLARTLIASFSIVMLGFGSMWILRPFIPGVIWSATLVVATWNLKTSLQNRINSSRWAVIIMMIALGALIFIPIGLVFATIANKTENILNLSKNLSEMNIPAPPVWLKGWTFIGDRLYQNWQKLSQTSPENLLETIQPHIRAGIAWIMDNIGSAGVFILNLLVTFILSGVFYNSGDKAAAGVIRFARRVAGNNGENSVLLVGSAIKAVALGIVVTTIIQSFLAWAGLKVAGIPNAGIITAVVIVFCIAQVGPLLPMLTGVGWLYYTGQNTVGTVFLIWSLAVGILDNFLRPILIRRGADLPFLLIFSGVVGGLIAFGVIGLFIGPVILAVTYRLLQAWTEKKEFVLETSLGTRVKPKPTAPATQPLDH